MEDFLTTKFGLWIDIRLSTDKTLHGRGRVVEKSHFFVQIEKATKSSGGSLTYHIFSLDKAVAHVAISNPIGISTIKK